MPWPDAKSFGTAFVSASSAESCIRKAVAERGFTPGLVGLADAKAEDEAASRWADFASPMGIESSDLGPPDAPGGASGVTGRSARGRVDVAMKSAGAVVQGVPTPPVQGGRSGIGV